MALFISYSNLDEDAVRSLASDLEDAPHSVWLDQDLRGGDAWWQAILRQIQSCDVFVLALSNNSLASKPCRAELRYALDLRRPVLPVQIGPVASLRTVPVSALQVVDYRTRSASAGIGLIRAVQNLAAQRHDLPDPLPEPPPIPYEYLIRLGAAISADTLNAGEQVGLLAQLREGLRTEDDHSARRDVVALIQALRNRPDTTYRTVNEIDRLLADAEPGSRSAEGASGGPHPPSNPGPQAPTVMAQPYVGQQPRGPQPLPGNQAQPQWQATPPQAQPTPPSGRSPFATIAMVLGVIAFFGPSATRTIATVVVGIVGILPGVVGAVRKERLGIVGLCVAIGGTVFGVLLAYLVYANG